MPTALIADDEDAPRTQLLIALARAWPELRVVAECANGIDAWDAFLEHEPEVCFLDVRMPGLTGIEVAQRIGAQAQIVFVTAHGDHALAAFDTGAVDYVLKPVDAARLGQATARVRARLDRPGDNSGALQRLLDQLVGQVRKPAPLEMIQAGIGREVKLVRTLDVVYFEADTRYTRVVYREPENQGQGDGEVLIRTLLKELIAQLDPQRFWQIHRSVIVNHREIASVVRQGDGNMLLTLRNRVEKLPVARHFQGLFRGR